MSRYLEICGSEFIKSNYVGSIIGSNDGIERAEPVGCASAMVWKGEYHPEVVVRHHRRRKAADAPGLWKCYAIGIGAFHMKLLMRSRQFLWFLRTVYQARWRYRSSRTFFFWELLLLGVGRRDEICLYLSKPGTRQPAAQS
jgi:hypothetical protein